jgi:tRNA pseudouridine38-40 synthase
VTRTIRLLLAYDGTEFRGWAAQRDERIRTVEGELVRVLSSVAGEPVTLSVAGRTDAGVHARGQVASFVTAADREVDAIRDSTNGRLGPEIVARDVRVAPGGFDARSSASAREYRYRVDLGPVPDPFSARFVWHRQGDPSLAAMRTAAGHLLGERDFTSFCRHPGPGRSTVRRLERVSITRSGDRLELRFRANAFLHQMVRALTGTLLAVGTGRIDPDAIPEILASRERSKARDLAPPHGLTLERVIYGRRSPQL